jgi:predicted ATPase/class 3 adenylate cyclase
MRISVSESILFECGMLTGMAERPTGTVTFLFTDLQGSTRLWEEHAAQMQVALERHDKILRSSIEIHGGWVFSTAGDAFAAAFARAGDAVAAAVDAQSAIGQEPWPAETPLLVRMGLHTGEAQERGGDYFGPALNRAARIMSAGHGGQTLVSATTAGLIEDNELVALGEHRLKDLSAPERLFQIGDGSFPALRTLKAARHNLPVERTTLVGRKEEIEEVALLVNEHRLVTLLGIGGTGKTRLATAVAAELADGLGDGVWFVNLVPVGEVGQVAEAIATAAGLQVAGTDLVGGLAELISGRDMLIVLDNCEHITDDVADVVDELLAHTVAPRFLATSREPLQLIDERQVHVAPLAVDDDDLAAPAIELFANAADLVGAHVGPDDLTAVSRICQQLDGLPLSIELAGALLRQLSIDELADRLHRRFELLSQRRGGRGRRRASLLGVLEDSWQMLDAQEQELLMQLAAFPADFDAEAVDAVTAGMNLGLPTHTLGGLIDRSLVAPAGDGRHRMLETVKLFAREQWSHTTEPGAHLDRHTRWILDHLTAYPTQDWYTSYEPVRWANRHYEDHRAVEDRLASAANTGDLARLMATLTYTYLVTRSQRASALIDRIDAYCDQLPLSDPERGTLNLVAASAGLPSRQPRVIARCSEQAVDLLRRDGGCEELATALTVASWMTAFSDLDRSLDLVDEAMNVAESAGASVIVEIALTYRANHLALDGRIDEAAATLARLSAPLEGRAFNNASQLHLVCALAVHVVSEPETAHREAAALVAGLDAAVGWFDTNWEYRGIAAIGAAAFGDIDDTRARLADTESALINDADDGLPDLLVPLAALAYASGEYDLARRWLTAVRRSPTPTLNFVFTVAYRQLRVEVGLLDHNPLDDATLKDIYREASDWLAAL